MIWISKKLQPQLRASQAMIDAGYGKAPPNNCLSFTERGRFYIVNTFKCNNHCSFCSFHKIQIQECSTAKLSKQIDRAFESNTGFSNYSISITGGEPLIKQVRLASIMESLQKHNDHIRWIGFGTNGSLPIPDYLLNKYDKKEIRFYISRHHYNEKRSRLIFGNPNPKQSFEKCVTSLTNKNHIKLAATCNLIKGQIDSLSELCKYLDWVKKLNIHTVVFRELNKIGKETASYPDPEIKRYMNYRERCLVDMNSILQKIQEHAEFEFVEQTVRPFIYHEVWKRNGTIITFRRISEEGLLSYNRQDSRIDELVLWPNSRLCGCWDYDMKVLEKEVM